MPYISKFTASDGVTYDLKDSEARDNKIGKIADHTISGAAGWYKFLEFQSTTSVRRKITLLIQDLRTTGAPIIVTSYLNPNSGGNTWSVIAGGSSLGGSPFNNANLAFYSENGTHTWYVKKVSGDGYSVSIQVLNSSNQVGTYIDLTDYWVSTKVDSLPSGATNPAPCSDGAGNVIIDTYQKKVTSGTISFDLNWNGPGPYTQTVTVTGATITSNSMISLQPTATQLDYLISDGVTALTIENNNGTLTAYALGSIPTHAMTVPCMVTEVAT